MCRWSRLPRPPNSRARGLLLRRLTIADHGTLAFPRYRSGPNPGVNMMDDRERGSWSGEFRSLGAQGVRRELAAARWPKDKLTAARYWLQLDDARTWQQRAPSHSPNSRSFQKWAKYIVAALFLPVVTLSLIRLVGNGP
jgi:hypothetical protein